MDHKSYFELASQQAELATCLRAKCGAVVVSSDGELIGKGYNAPPKELDTQRMCDVRFDIEFKPNYDKTCCIHAEWNAILDACKHHADKINGSTLYFMRIDDAGNFTEAGQPFCTVCSRLALESGVQYFALWNNGPDIRSTEQYNLDSYRYHIDNR